MYSMANDVVAIVPAFVTRDTRKTEIRQYVTALYVTKEASGLVNKTKTSRPRLRTQKYRVQTTKIKSVCETETKSARPTSPRPKPRP